MTYKIGILIVGSLYWDGGLNSPRDDWRRSRLSGDVFDVFAPIRYGKKSRKRGDTYTMVFSRLCLRKDYGLGSAKVMTCSSEIKNINEMIDEAEHIWAAERDERNTNGQFWADWGTVGYLSNSSSKFPNGFFHQWESKIKKVNIYQKFPHAKSEKSVLSDNGTLNFPWPLCKDTNQPVPLDVLLATATKPTSCYPTHRQIAEAWNEDTGKKGDNVNYFRENRKNGLCTFQDDLIERLLIK